MPRSLEYSLYPTCQLNPSVSQDLDFPPAVVGPLGFPYGRGCALMGGNDAATVVT